MELWQLVNTLIRCSRNYIHVSEHRYVVHGTMTAPSIQIRHKQDYDSSASTDTT